MTRRIKAQAGTDEANFGETRFPVPADGIIEVPDEAAAALLATGGFSEIDEPIELPDGLVRLKGQPNSGCTVQGVSYTADETGIIAVPAFAVEALASHGFWPVSA
jgi:hypothetical protein